MKLKRMAVVAAAAVVGPTVLMATPAMAEEKPAAIVPDAAPKDDTAPTEAPIAQAQAPAGEAAVTPPVAKTPATAPAPAVQPAVPAAKPAPEPKTPAPVVSNHEHEDWDDEFAVAEGPKVSISGLPKAGFKAGGDWQKIKFKVDNSGRGAVQDYGFGLLVADQFGKLKDKHLQLDVLDGNQWVPASTFADEVGGSEGVEIGFAGRLFQVESVDANETFTMDLRLRFTKGTPVGDIQIIAAGGSMDEDASVESEPSFYESKITKASTGGNTSGGNTSNGNNNPTPDGGAEPINDTTTNNSGNGTGTNTGGQLAETGTDAATSWALGSAGVALAMGAALVAGTGKRRRPTA
ncbi:hypothetical protein [Streptomyces sp. NBC_01565]|uniref:hypothetical protein n=1 Tax=unclassified Streptomyces TaxID=2593676 RepID=UPI002252E2A8|nr:hypothetical protein [Streptomyces sp. NBC_01565]MCX4546785.1 hypothetical protein [Streptomyces sp. NBC_01565]